MSIELFVTEGADRVRRGGAEGLLGLLDGTRVDDIRIAYGGMAALPQRARACEKALLGTEWSAAGVAKACTLLAEDFTPISDMRSSAAYRDQVAQNLLRRFYLESTGDEDCRVYQYGR